MSEARQRAHAFQAANPNTASRSLTLGAECDAERTVQAGGALQSLLLHPSITPFQWVFRVLPPVGIYDASPSRPVQFEVGAFTVPQKMSLALGEALIRPYRFSGAAVGDVMPLEDRRCALQIGYDLNFSMGVVRKANLNAEILPAVVPLRPKAMLGVPQGGTIMSGVPVQGGPLPTLSGQAGVPTIYTTPTSDLAFGAPAQFPSSFVDQFPDNSEQYIRSASAGAALLPQNQKPSQGPEQMPFTYYVDEAQPVQLRVTVFGPVPVMLAMFEGVLAGYLMAANTLKASLKAVRPCE